MKLLFDQNLSRKLVTRLTDIFLNSSHVQFHALTEAEDSEIWEFAKTQDFCIVTQDADFAERSRLYGSPPKVIWLHAVAMHQQVALKQFFGLVLKQFKNL